MKTKAYSTLTIAAIAAIISIISYIHGNTPIQMAFLVIEWCAVIILIAAKVKTDSAEKEKEVEEPDIDNEYQKLVAEHRKICQKITQLDFALKAKHTYRYDENNQIVIVSAEEVFRYSCSRGDHTVTQRYITSLNGELIQMFEDASFDDTVYNESGNRIPVESKQIIEKKLRAKIELLRKKMLNLAEEISDYVLSDVELPTNEAEAPVFALDGTYFDAEAIETTPYDGEFKIVSITIIDRTANDANTFVTHVPV